MSNFIKELDAAFTVMDKVNTAAVRGAISHEDKDKIIRLIQENVADIVIDEVKRRYPQTQPSKQESKPEQAPETEAAKDKSKKK